MQLNKKSRQITKKVYGSTNLKLLIKQVKRDLIKSLCSLILLEKRVNAIKRRKKGRTFNHWKIEKVEKTFFTNSGNSEKRVNRTETAANEKDAHTRSVDINEIVNEWSEESGRESTQGDRNGEETCTENGLALPVDKNKIPNGKGVQKIDRTFYINCRNGLTQNETNAERRDIEKHGKTRRSVDISSSNGKSNATCVEPLVEPEFLRPVHVNGTPTDKRMEEAVKMFCKKSKSREKQEDRATKNNAPGSVHVPNSSRSIIKTVEKSIMNRSRNNSRCFSEEQRAKAKQELDKLFCGIRSPEDLDDETSRKSNETAMKNSVCESSSTSEELPELSLVESSNSEFEICDSVNRTVLKNRETSKTLETSDNSSCALKHTDTNSLQSNKQSDKIKGDVLSTKERQAALISDEHSKPVGVDSLHIANGEANKILPQIPVTASKPHADSRFQTSTPLRTANSLEKEMIAATPINVPGNNYDPKELDKKFFRNLQTISMSSETTFAVTKTIDVAAEESEQTDTEHQQMKKPNGKVLKKRRSHGEMSSKDWVTRRSPRNRDPVKRNMTVVYFPTSKDVNNYIKSVPKGKRRITRGRKRSSSAEDNTNKTANSNKEESIISNTQASSKTSGKKRKLYSPEKSFYCI